jgi:hypothetical protein
MTAKYFDMREAKGAKACGKMLSGILSTTDGESTCLPDENLIRTPSTTLSLSDLSDNGLFTIEEIDSYRQLSHLDIEMRRVKGTLRGLDPTLLRVKGHRDLTDPTLTLAGSDPGTLQSRAIRVSGSRAGSRVP